MSDDYYTDQQPSKQPPANDYYGQQGLPDYDSAPVQYNSSQHVDQVDHLPGKVPREAPRPHTIRSLEKWKAFFFLD